MKFSAVAFLALALTSSLVMSAEISDVMKDAMKGETSLYKKVATGKGTDADAQKLLEYVKELPGQAPSKGEADSWKEKTEKLVKAAEGVTEKKPGALQQLQTAGNCKACHSAHKGD